MRKLYEINDLETQKRYIKKYHLEYLFDSPESDLTLTSESQSHQNNNQNRSLKKKRITFTDSTEKGVPLDKYHLDDDDDFIIPVMTKHPPPPAKGGMKPGNGTYKRFPIQPEENIWVKNVADRSLMPPPPARSVNSSSAASSSSNDYSNYNVSEREFVL